MASPKKTATKKVAAGKKTVGKKSVAKKAVNNKNAAKKSTAKKSAPVKSAKKNAKSKPAAKKSAKKASAKKVVATQLTPKQREAARKAAAREKEAARKAAAKAKEAARKEAAKQKELARKEALKKKEAAKKEAALLAAAKKAEKEAARAAKEAAKEAARQAAKVVAPPPVQVINPIGGDVIPKVRKAVPGKKAAPKRPVVEEDESKWTKTELNQVRKVLLKEVAELEVEIAAEEERFHNLIVESGEGAGDDQADAGAKTFEREHEISILSNKKDLLDQSLRALERIEAGTYGFCENCGKPIGKLRLLEANPRATLCMPCREREDRS